MTARVMISSRLEPVELLALVDHQLQRAHPDHQQGQARQIERRLPVRRLASAVHRPGHRRRDQAHRNVDVEDPGPRDVVGDPAAKQRAHHRRHQHRDARGGERGAGPCRRIAGEQQGLRQGHQRPGSEALQHAGEDQHLERAGHAAQPREGRERGHAAHHQPHLTEAACQPAGERHRDGIGHAEGGHHPGALGGAHAHVAGDRRQRDIGDRAVEHRHEGGQRHPDGADQPGAALQRLDGRRRRAHRAAPVATGAGGRTNQIGTSSSTNTPADRWKMSVAAIVKACCSIRRSM